MSPYEENSAKTNEGKQTAWTKNNPLRDRGMPFKPNTQEQSSSLEDSCDPEVASVNRLEVDRLDPKRRSKM